MKQLSLRPLSWTEERRNGLIAFLLGFGSLLLVLLPILIADGGYYIYYGDYNSQQIPFYQLANDAVRTGSFGWNWYTDLGANFIGSYSFYLLGSPFFWLSVLLPRSWVVFAMPFLLCLKHGVAALTAYAYIRRFVRNPKAAMIGGMLYAFSGFQLFNIFFNHFQDVTAFFPLMLIAMEECVNENRRGVFALSVALMAMLNYFFFTGQVVFLILYFVLRCGSKDFAATFRKFLVLLVEAVLGVMMACILLLPSALAILANNRVSERLYGMDMIAYSDRTRIWRILLSLFLIPDVPARPNLFSSDYAKWASIGGYLPLFSMAGVIAFLKKKDGHWAKRLTILCAVCACIPILNSCFYALNGSYYARWFYMPILILTMMTAYALDNRSIRWKLGFQICTVCMVGFGLISLLPTKSQNKIQWGSFAEYPAHFYLVLGACAVFLAVAAYLLHRRKNRKPFLQLALICTTGACIASTMIVVYFGAFTPARARTYVDQAIDPEQESPFPFPRTITSGLIFLKTATITRCSGSCRACAHFRALSRLRLWNFMTNWALHGTWLPVLISHTMPCAVCSRYNTIMIRFRSATPFLMPFRKLISPALSMIPRKTGSIGFKILHMFPWDSPMTPTSPPISGILSLKISEAIF